MPIKLSNYFVYFDKKKCSPDEERLKFSRYFNFVWGKNFVLDNVNFLSFTKVILLHCESVI